jgi:hypothetical protein
MSDVKETAEFKACVAKVFRKTMLDTIILWMKIIIIGAWIFGLSGTIVSLVTPTPNNLPNEFRIAFYIITLVGTAFLSGMWLYGKHKDAIKECEEVYRIKELQVEMKPMEYK